MYLATSWNGHGMTTGTCTVHSWNDGLDEDEAEPKMGRRVDAQLFHDGSLYSDDNDPRIYGPGQARMARLRRRNAHADDE